MDLASEVFLGPLDFQFKYPSNELFGGFFSWLQRAPILATPMPYLLILVLLLMAFYRSGRRLVLNLILGLISLNSILLSLRLSTGFDEFYINLKHSWVFQNTGAFSFNLSSRGEATVDFFPYFLTGVLGKLGFPLQETVITINLVGNIIFIMLVYMVLTELGNNSRQSLMGAFVSSFFPAYLYVGATGFTAGLFCSFILLSFYFVLVDRIWLSVIFLSFTPLIRIEGALFCFLFWALFLTPGILGKEESKLTRFLELVKWGVLLAIPFVSLSTWRLLYFGSILPIPVVFKNAENNMFFLKAGFSQLWDGFLAYRIPVLLMAFVFWTAYRLRLRVALRKGERKVFLFWLISALFVLPYHLGGGDWFPVIWGRYTLANLQFSWLVYLISALGIAKLMERRGKDSWKVSGVFIFLICIVPFLIFKNTFSEIKHGGNKWIRVEDLAAFGEFLNLTSDPTDIIASPEVATIMYFAKRDVLDLLGVANTDIARAPLNPLSPGNILHRRRNPKTIYDRKPEFIAFYGCESRTYFDFHKAGSEKLVKFIEESSFTDVKAGIALYRGGSMRRLLNLGYRNLTVFLGHGYFNYFVSAPAYQRHIERLESLGLRSLGELSVKVPSTESMEKLFPDPI